ncbi:hypothetical protein [Planctomycetes bacterium TBK1r]|uniref:Uncharacterized protein n=1 Tax=Stieleria magnilauensis TaxID=2527963 RepID=A0ABX5XP12_9BACT|nr:hypothetical protein TBK1r_26850 [Planctomycetes bacterium TBK1r]
MKRLLMVAMTAGILSVGIGTARTEAADFIYRDYHHGPAYGHRIVGGHRSSGVHHIDRGIGVYGGHGLVGHGTHYPHYGSGYRGYISGHHVPAYRSYRPIHRSQGGVHLDVGPLHFGIGGH